MNALRRVYAVGSTFISDDVVRSIGVAKQPN